MSDAKPEETPETPSAPVAAIEELKPESGMTDTLIAEFEGALQREGLKAYERWGVALFHSVSDERAARDLAAIGVPLRDALDHYNRGCLAAIDEKFEDAAKAFAKAAELDPTLTEARFNLALALEKSGQGKKARDIWKALAETVEDEEEAAAIKAHLEPAAE